MIDDDELFPIDVECPVCHVKPAEDCVAEVMVGGHYRFQEVTWFHGARILLAEEGGN